MESIIDELKNHKEEYEALEEIAFLAGTTVENMLQEGRIQVNSRGNVEGLDLSGYNLTDLPEKIKNLRLEYLDTRRNRLKREYVRKIWKELRPTRWLRDEENYCGDESSQN